MINVARIYFDLDPEHEVVDTSDTEEQAILNSSKNGGVGVKKASVPPLGLRHTRDKLIFSSTPYENGDDALDLLRLPFSQTSLQQAESDSDDDTVCMDVDNVEIPLAIPAANSPPVPQIASQPHSTSRVMSSNPFSIASRRVQTGAGDSEAETGDSSYKHSRPGGSPVSSQTMGQTDINESSLFQGVVKGDDSLTTPCKPRCLLPASDDLQSPNSQTWDRHQSSPARLDDHVQPARPESQILVEHTDSDRLHISLQADHLPDLSPLTPPVSSSPPPSAHEHAAPSMINPSSPNDRNNEDTFGEGNRYSFRRRTALQKNPYLMEAYLYKSTLKGHQDAMVPRESLDRHARTTEIATADSQEYDDEHPYVPGDFTQEDVYLDSDNPHRFPSRVSRVDYRDNSKSDRFRWHEESEEHRHEEANRSNKRQKLHALSHQSPDPVPSSSRVLLEDIPVNNPPIPSALQVLNTELMTAGSRSRLHKRTSSPTYQFQDRSPEKTFDSPVPARPQSVSSTDEPELGDDMEGDRNDHDSSSDASEEPVVFKTRKQLERERLEKRRMKILKRMRPDLVPSDEFEQAKAVVTQKRPPQPVSTTSGAELQPGRSRYHVSDRQLQEEVWDLDDQLKPCSDDQLDEQSDDDIEETQIQDYARATTAIELSRTAPTGQRQSREGGLYDRMLSRTVRINPLGRTTQSRRHARRQQNPTRNMQRRRQQTSNHTLPSRPRTYQQQQTLAVERSSSPTSANHSHHESPDGSLSGNDDKSSPAILSRKSTTAQRYAHDNLHREPTAYAREGLKERQAVNHYLGSLPTASRRRSMKSHRTNQTSRPHGGFAKRRLVQSRLEASDFVASHARGHPRTSLKDSIQHYYPDDETEYEYEEPPNLPRAEARLTTDCGVKPLKTGLIFNLDSYLGSGQLRGLQLLASGEFQAGTVPVFSGLDLLLTHQTTSVQLAEAMPRIIEHLSGLATGSTEFEMTGAKSVFEFLRLYISNMAHHGENQAFSKVSDTLLAHSDTLMASLSRVTTDGEARAACLFLHWQLVDLVLRILITGKRLQIGKEAAEHITTRLRDAVRGVTKYLFRLGLARSLISLDQLSTLDPSQDVSVLALQSWICLIHLLQDILPSVVADLGVTVLWEELANTLNDGTDRTNLEMCEQLWTDLFSLCAISQFSIHGISKEQPTLRPSWDIVNKALKLVTLTTNVEADKGQRVTVLEKRDRYTRLMSSRCFLLCSRWCWDLDDGSQTLQKLTEIFRTRNYTNLSGEQSDFPLFIRNLDLGLLDAWQSEDTTHASLMKFLVKFLRSPGGSAAIPKTISNIVPVSPVEFTKDSPPMGNEISQLYNRFTASFVAIVVQPKHAKARLKGCKGYTNFERADMETRIACIRAMMSFTVLYQHLHLDLDDVFQWSADFWKQILREITEDAAGRKGAELSPSLACVQLLLASARKALSCSSMDRTMPAAESYPDIRFLEPVKACIGNIPKSIQSRDWRTADEIRQLVEIFLEKRSRNIPKVIPAHDSMADSQEEYGQFDFDLHDPELIAALGGEEGGISKISEVDRGTAELIDKVIEPYFYARICKQAEEESTIPVGNQDALCCDFRWVDCWVRCASVVVSNNMKNWTSYISLGPTSWNRISDPIRRRLIGVRFMYGLLKLDQKVHNELHHRACEIFFQCLVASFPVMEHDYIDLLLALDDNHDPLLRHVSDTRRDARFSTPLLVDDFLSTCLEMLHVICINFQNIVEELSRQQQPLVGRAVALFEALLTAMQDNLMQNGNQTDAYHKFCARVLDLLSLPALLEQTSISRSVAQLRKLIPQST